MRAFIAISCLFITSIALADICPSVAELQSTENKVRHWNAYDSDNGKRLTTAREQKLIHSITHFAMAEWSNQHNHSTIHCYYNDDHGATMEAYFAKDSVLPITSSRYWYQVTGMMQCAASADKCQFQTLPGTTHQLAQSDE